MKFTGELLDIFFKYISYEIVDNEEQPQDEDNEIELDIEDGT